MAKIGVITDVFEWRDVVGGLPAESTFFYSPREGLPAPAELAQLDTILIFGQLGDSAVALQLVGIVKLALERSHGTLAFAYPVHAEKGDLEFMQAFGYRSREFPVWTVSGYPAEFHSYFTEYGVSGTGFVDEHEAVVIGSIGTDPTFPTALCSQSETGAVFYVVPYHISGGGNPGRMVETLYGAVTSHGDALVVSLPDYVSDLRLGAAESELLTEIDRAERALSEKRANATKLAGWRNLVGRTSGQAFVELVVDGLNLLLTDTDYRAETRADVGVEDFWIAGRDGDVALAEAKGIAGGIARANVGQVDSHREERGLPPEFPGLLVVNVFRGDDDLVRKRSELIAPNVVALARVQNVLVMRGWDLYQLIGRKLGGEDSYHPLLDALHNDEGGWLRVNEDGIAVIAN